MNKKFVVNFLEWLYLEALSNEIAAGMYVEITNKGLGHLTQQMCTGLASIIENPEIKTAYQEHCHVPNRFQSGWEAP